jgi:diguanylate cyclase (GGDEF)-like protein
MTGSEQGHAAEAGEIMGVLLVGVVEAFRSLHVISARDAASLAGDLVADQWYPLQRFVGLFERLSGAYAPAVRAQILERAGRNFIAAWRAGPGREVSTGRDFLKLQGDGAGYHSVVRGPKVAVGEVALESLDTVAGHAVIRSTAPFPVDFERGVFGGGLALYEDMAWVELDTHVTPGSAERRFELHFRECDRRADDALARALADPVRAMLTPDEARELLWRYRGLVQRDRRETAYWTQVGYLFESTLDRLHALTRELQRQADTDSLTGLTSRRRVFEIGECAVAESHASGAPLAAMMMDIDHFKLINDVHGHRAGDAVLRAFGDLAADWAGATRLIGRVGGEEFLAVLPGETSDAARAQAEDLLTRVRTGVFVDAARTHPVTLSVGIAYMRPGDTLDALVARADRALYAAKHSGRDCVEAHF